MADTDEPGGARPDAHRTPEAFAQRVVQVLEGTRPGDVVTYGEVAAEAATPGAARAVGRVLRDHGGDLPWWRVVTATGRLVPGLEDRQASLLAAEGVVCANGRVVRSPPAART